MAGIRWSEKETDSLHAIVADEKIRAKKVGVQINWKRITKKLNSKFKNNRTEKGCFWCYQRTRAQRATNNQIPVRYPRPKNPSTVYEKVVNAEEYWISVSDDEGNVIFSLLVKNTAVNVSRMLTESVMKLNDLKDNS